MVSFVHSSIFAGLAAVVTLSAGFVCNVIIARMLGPAGSGAAAFGIWAALTAYAFANVGIPYTLLRYMLRYDKPGHPGGGLARFLLPKFLIPVAAMTVALLVYVVLAPDAHVDGAYAPDVFLMVALLYLVYAIAWYAEGAARGLHHAPAITRNAVVGAMIQVPAVALGAYFFGVAGAIFGYVLRYVPQAFSIGRYIKQDAAPEVTFGKDMYAYARDMWFTGILGSFVWGRIEYLFLSIYVSPAQLGFYAAGWTLAALVKQLPSHTLAALTTHLGSLHDRGDDGAISRTYQRTLRWLALFSFPVCLGGAAIMQQLFPFIFGEEFAQGWIVAAILVGTAFLGELREVPRMLIGARERSGVVVKFTVVFAILSVIAFAIAVPAWGLIGAAVTRFGLDGLMLVAMAAYCWRDLSVKLDAGNLLACLVAAALCSLGALGVMQVLDGVAALIVAVLAGAVIFLAALRFLNCVPREDALILETALSRILPAALQPAVSRSLRFIAR